MVENFTLETQAAVDVMICANQTVEMVEMAVHNMVLPVECSNVLLGDS